MPAGIGTGAVGASRVVALFAGAGGTRASAALDVSRTTAIFAGAGGTLARTTRLIRLATIVATLRAVARAGAFAAATSRSKAFGAGAGAGATGFATFGFFAGGAATV